ncbi:MAG: hypothetical protein ACI9O4_002344 [Chitinophagales bacterium]
MLLTVSLVQGQVDIIANGSFETGDTTNWEVSAVTATDQGPGSFIENWIVLMD